MLTIPATQKAEGRRNEIEVLDTNNPLVIVNLEAKQEMSTAVTIDHREHGIPLTEQTLLIPPGMEIPPTIKRGLFPCVYSF